MRSHELSLDVYAEEVSYGQVGQVTAETRGFLWQHETEDQATTKRMDWNALLEYLQTVAPRKRSGFYLRKQIGPDVALGLGIAATKEISDVLGALIPLYDASVGV